MTFSKLLIPALSIGLSVLSISYSTFQNDRATNAEVINEHLQEEVNRLLTRERELLLEVCELQERPSCEVVTYTYVSQPGLKRNPLSLLAPVLTN